MGKNRNKVLRGVIGFGMGKIRKGDMSVENQIYKLQAAAVCHRGRVRANNEDNLFFDHKILREQHEGIRGCLTAEESTGQPQLMGVFDGMGGHAKGEKASWMMAGTVGRRFDGKKPEKPEELIPEFLIDLCMKTNADVCKEMEKAKSRIGTTASMLYFYQDAVWVCNIGDSPIYCYRGDVLEEIYQEHTERLLRQKIYGEENVKGKKFPLTQHIGIFPDEMKIQPYTASIPLQEGDQYLICSDGLTDMVDGETIAGILSGREQTSEKAERLRDKALENGGRDNITIILVSVGKERKNRKKDLNRYYSGSLNDKEEERKYAAGIRQGMERVEAL